MISFIDDNYCFVLALEDLPGYLNNKRIINSNYRASTAISLLLGQFLFDLGRLTGHFFGLTQGYVTLEGFLGDGTSRYFTNDARKPGPWFLKSPFEG